MHSECSIRAFRASDRLAVVALWDEVFPNDPPWNDPNDVIDRKGAVQPELFLVCESETRIAGTVLAGFDGVRGWIHHLAVAPRERRRGFATRLLHAAERELAARGCPKLNLQVRAGNTRAIAFYESVGLATEDRVSMGKPLGRWARP